ncbi:MAG: hypothetical protein ACRECY_15810 [Phyllobacterium sp.]
MKPASINDNSLQTDAQTSGLALLIERHRQVRQIVMRLERVYARYRTTGVDCRLLADYLCRARRREQQARHDLLLWPVETVQQAASKAAHLRLALLQDEAADAARV